MKSTDESSERGRLRALASINEADSFILLACPEDGETIEILTHMRGDHVPHFLSSLQTAGMSLLREAIDNRLENSGATVTDLTDTLLSDGDDDAFEVPDTLPTDWKSKAGMLPCGCLVLESGGISKCPQHWAERDETATEPDDTPEPA